MFNLKDYKDADYKIDGDQIFLNINGEEESVGCAPYKRIGGRQNVIDKLKPHGVDNFVELGLGFGKAIKQFKENDITYKIIELNTKLSKSINDENIINDDFFKYINSHKFENTCLYSATNNENESPIKYIKIILDLKKRGNINTFLAFEFCQDISFNQLYKFPTRGLFTYIIKI